MLIMIIMTIMLNAGRSPALYTCGKYGSACRHATLAALPTPTSKMLERVV